jgi:hypothetical protein
MLESDRVSQVLQNSVKQQGDSFQTEHQLTTTYFCSVSDKHVKSLPTWPTQFGERLMEQILYSSSTVLGCRLFIST